ncbi:Rieske 2Fe-2S domain-containing protein [Brachybacterium sp. J144]|uniref:cytochrome bc1 complex Rieske iron-sulfur subunit n=1 Tax=Brachybacterium sp. J144 TaxID=3116487 RepID=UPI002E799C9B|nr:Rieske 2Fe-2S domain-containing protein [Brachybacterium sp. J144]MEE1651324.1 Rieske 2Fe-2S domain-containing protein [Brachybacterium sp. J144]
MNTNLDGTNPARGVSAVAPKEDGGFPNPGLPPHVHRQADHSKTAEKRAERLVAGMFLLSVLGTAVFIAAYFLVTPTGRNIFAEEGTPSALWWSNLVTGLGLAIAVFFIGAAAVHWAKTLMPDEEMVEERHDIRSSEETREVAAGIITDGFAESGIARRPVIVTAMVAAFAALPIAVLAPLSTLGPLPGNKLHHTFWGHNPGQRLARDHDGTPIKLSDVAMNSIFHVMPEGLTQETPHFLEERAKAAAVIVRIDPKLAKNEESMSQGVQGVLAFSKICTHVGCPVALYEQQTHHMLCPCHQSTFDVTDGAKVIFGPAHRPLPQLPIEVDDEGYLVAPGDFNSPIGPSFWNIHKDR